MIFNIAMKPLLSKNQLRLLKVFLTNPEKSFYMQEIGRIIGKKAGAFQHTLNALEHEGLLKSEYRANARYFQVNAEHTIYPELKKIVAKTVGIEGSLRTLVEGIKDVHMSLIYGSFAKGSERSGSDVDLLVVGDPKVEKTLLKEVPKLEKQLQREINYKLYSDQEFRDKKKKKDAFLAEVLGDKTILLKGDSNVV